MMMKKYSKFYELMLNGNEDRLEGTYSWVTSFHLLCINLLSKSNSFQFEADHLLGHS